LDAVAGEEAVMKRNLGQHLKPPVVRCLLRSLGIVVVVWMASSPSALHAQTTESLGKRRPLVTVYLKKGEHFTLRDAEFLHVQKGEHPPRGSRPPNTPVGPIPGNTPGGYPGDDPGPKWPKGRDPRQPTHSFSGQPRGAGEFLGPGLNGSQMKYLRRVDIIRVEKDITYGDFTFKNGETRIDVPMTWTAISGWERPGRSGELYFFDAEDILFLEFPLH
jgi:hypothetical protein